MLSKSQDYNGNIIIKLDINDVNEKFHLFKLLSLMIVFFRICLHLNNYHNSNFQRVTQKSLDLKVLLLLTNKNYSIFEDCKKTYSNKKLSENPNFLFENKSLNIKLKFEEIKIEKLLRKKMS